MSQPSVDSPAPLSGLFAIALVATGLLVEHRTPAPARPTSSTTIHVRHQGRQRVPARLWEDPLAVCDAAAHSDPKNPSASPGAVKPCWLQDQWKAEDHKPGPERTLLFVLTAELGREEAAETRRRTRYAAIAALETAGYRPRQPDYIGYFEHNDSIVAFEEFAPIPDLESSKGPVVVCWLPEPEYRDDPCQQLYRLWDRIAPEPVPSGRDPAKVLAIGPDSSSSLATLVASARAWSGAPPTPDANRRKAFAPKFYTGTATLDDQRLGIGRTPWETFGTPLLDGSVQIIRTTINDQRVLDAILGELTRRTLDLEQLGRSEHVLIVSPLDDQYGEKMAEQFRDSITRSLAESGGSSSSKESVRHFTYMRGLDGIQPGDGPTTTASRNRRAHGGRQFDYIERLGRRIRREYGNGQKVAAVGVLGSDTYDKLNVLQALRPQFPHAVFFTTDLDARLTDPAHFQFTRNLIVGSAFGLELASDLQGDHPPLRDNYSTARYYATLCALGHARFEAATVKKPVEPLGATPRGGAAVPADADSRAKRGTLAESAMNSSSAANATKPQSRAGRTLWSSEHRLAPRLFEIGRRGAFPLNIEPDKTPTLHRADLSASEFRLPIADIHPNPNRSATWLFATVWRLPVLVLLGLAVLLVARRYRSDCLPSRTGQSVWQKRAVAARWLGAGVAAALLLWANIESTQPWGEPWAIFDGTSAWPSILIAVIAVTVACKGICLTLHELEAVRTRIEQDYGVDANREPVESADTSAGKLKDANRLWRDYCTRTDTLRIWKIALVLATAFVVVALTLWLAEGRSLHPARSTTSRCIHFVVFALAGCAMTYLICLQWHWASVCRRVARRIETERWRWPKAPVRAAVADQSDPRSVDEYVEVRFFAELSDAAGSVASFPFIVLLILACARSTVFDYWPWTPVDFALAAVLVISVLGSWWLLRSRAEALRERSLHDLKLAYYEAVARPGQDSPRPDGLREMLEEVRDTRRGAFASLASNPAVRAMYLPIGGLSGLAALDSFAAWL